MNFKHSLIVFIFLFFHQTLLSAVKSEDFYRVFSSGTLNEINLCIRDLESEVPSSRINAYRGALMMKKAGFEKVPKIKLNTFKLGHRLLETEISNDPDNTEFHFLRLAVCERAPGLLNFKKNLHEDRNQIIKGFRKLETGLQYWIEQYCKHSTILTIKDLQ